MTTSNQAPTVLGNLLQPGFPFAKVFSLFFMENSLVFAKTGSGGTNAAGTMQGALGGFTPEAMISSAIGSLVDSGTAASRAGKTAEMASQNAAAIVASHKKNFLIPFDQVKSVEIKGPNFAGELKVIVEADKTHKFRIDRQSKESAKYVVDVFSQFLPGKVVVK